MISSLLLIAAGIAAAAVVVWLCAALKAQCIKSLRGRRNKG